MAVREYFWGAELNDKKKEIVWDPDQEDQDNDLDSSGLTHFLFLKQAVLGAKAKPDERNVVEVEAEDFDGNTVKQPLFSLKLGLNESTILDVGAQPPLTLRLISGSGPVHLCGQHALEVTEDDLDLLDDDEAEEESPAKMSPLGQTKKRPASTNGGPTKKAKLEDTKKKVIVKADEDDSDEDEDFDVNMGDDSDEEDSDDEEDESDEEDGDDDEKEKSKTPEKKKVGKVNGAGPKKEAKDKESSKGKEKKPLTVDQVKKLLSQSPTKPKKQMKFTNLVKNTYKINDDKVLGELWTWYKESVLKG